MAWSRIFARWLNRLWLIFAAVVITTAVLLSLARAFLPFIDVIRPDIESFLSQKTGARISIGQLSAEWLSHGPKIIITDLEIEQNPWLLAEVKDLSIAVNLWQTMLNLGLATDEIKINKSTLRGDLTALLAKGKNSRSSNDYTSFDFLVESLLGQNDVLLTDIEVNVSRKGFQYSPLTIDRLSINVFDEIHQITGDIAQQNGGQLKLVAELYGDPRYPESRLQVYAESDSVDLSRLPLFESVISGLVKQGDLSGELWASWRFNQWESVVMDLTLEPVIFEINRRAFEYEKISAQVLWNENSSQQRQFYLKQLKAIDSTGSIIDLAGLKVDFAREPETLLTFEYSNVKPGKLNNVWALLIDESELQDWFLAANPQLTVDNFSLTLTEEDGDWDIHHGQMNLSEVHLSRTRVSPEMPVFSGKINLEKDKVNFAFKSVPGQIDYRPLFRWPIGAENIQVAGEFFSFDEGSYLVFEQFDMVLDGATVAAQGNLYFQSGSAPEISLQAELLNADIKKKSLYFPVEEMGQELVDYLDESVHGGTIDYARFNLQGKLVAGFLNQSDLTFDIMAHAKGLDYQYQPDFPKLDTLDANLFFTQDSMFVSATKATYESIDVQRANASIADFSAKDPKLVIDIRASSDHKSAKTFIESSSLKENLGSLLDDLQPQEYFSVALQLSVPLESSGETGITGQVNLNKTPINIPPLDLSLDQVTGKLNFTTSKIWSDGLSVAALNGTTQVTLNTTDADGARHLQMTAKGDVDSEQAVTWLLGGKSLPVQGKTPVSLSGWICLDNCTAGLSRVEVESNLKGVAIELSEPLSKRAAETQSLRVAIDQLSQSQHIEFTVGQTLNGALNYQRDGERLNLVQGNISVGEGNSAVSLVNNTLSVSVRLGAIQLEQLLNEINRVSDAFSSESESNTSSLPLLVSITIDSLDIHGIQLNNISGSMESIDNDQYKVTFESAESAGVLLVNNDKSIDIQLSQLILQDENFIESMDEADPRERVAAIQQLPNINFKCDSCVIKSVDLGKVTSSVKVENDRLFMSGQLFREGLLDATYETEWNLSEQQTKSDITLSSRRIGRLLRDWGVAIGIRDSAATSELSLNWQGAPYDFALERLNGSASLSIGSGYLEEVSDAKARIFSLFSMQSVFRRLALDFKDIYKKGFFYDSIKSQFVIDTGVLKTTRMEIDGAAANVSITGDVNLVAKTVDQLAVVSPKVTSSLPVLAGWAVEPTTGVIVWLLSKMFEPAIDVITKIEYRMVGSWDNPQVIELSKSTKEVELTEEQLEAIRKVQEGNQNGDDKPQSDSPSEALPPQQPESQSGDQ